MNANQTALTDAEKRLQGDFKGGKSRKMPSTARPAARSKRVDQMVLPDSERGPMPLTKEKFIVKEPENLVAWERELRKFLRQLSPSHEHRVAAVMVFEWATGINLAELMAEEKEARERGEKLETTWRGDLRHLNRLLREYFGDSYMTYIAGRKVPRAYKVPGGYRIKYHRPKTMTLWVEWSEGVLNP